nr:crosslink repair DNA glycosylase YcaQ family protein [uncultured Rhodoferax sp.]
MHLPETRWPKSSAIGCQCDDCGAGLLKGLIRRTCQQIQCGVGLAPAATACLPPLIVIDGRVVGTWKRVFKKAAIEITATPFTPLSPADAQGFAAAVQRYGAFHKLPVWVMSDFGL